MSNNSSNTFVTPCFKSKEAMVSFAVSITILLLVLPVFLYVLYLGCQKWRQQCSTSTPMSHFDVFLCHSFALDIISVLGYILFFVCEYFNYVPFLLVGLCTGMIASFGKDLLHVLTCVDRYLAVVKPITYQRLRETRGVRIKNISIGCVWLLSIINLVVALLSNYKVRIILYLCTTSFFIFVISFSNISLLCLLKPPGLGGLSGNRQRVTPSKRRAFYIIMAIMFALLFRLGGYLIIFVIAVLIRPRYSGFCVVTFLTFFLELPSSLMLPLLFLQGAGKLQCCKQTNESG